MMLLFAILIVILGFIVFMITPKNNPRWILGALGIFAGMAMGLYTFINS